MNQHLRSPSLSATTQPAEGLPRRRWTVAEIDAAVQAGIIDPHEHFELIGGETVPLRPRSLAHEVLKGGLNYHFARALSEEYRFGIHTTFRLSEDSFVEPDFIFFRKADGIANLNPRTALLAVELADSSLGWDLGRKALIYASFGIPEMWVIEAVSHTTHVHSRPGMQGYAEIRQLPESETLSAKFVPGLAVTLSALEYF